MFISNRKLRVSLEILVLLGAVVIPATLSGHSYGPAPRRTGAPGDNAAACTQCHGGNALNSGEGSVRIVLQSGPVYIPGVKQRVVVQVADPNAQRWGFEMTARLNSNLQDGQAGDLTPVDNMTQVICEDNAPKPCASGVLFITHTSVGSRLGTRNGASFQFDWTPPATDVGKVTLYVAGNAANGDGTSNGDRIYTSNIELTPLNPAKPSIAAGGVVSAATMTAVPVSGNSWITIKGTDLAVTTRGFNELDLSNGMMPLSLDGVSAMLIQFGAPRLLYVGYVSPTQLNVLLPNDLNLAAATIQVRNSAGISAGSAITLAANGPQLFSSDTGALASHADGSLVTKAAPAAPGETIGIYATGVAGTTAALTPGIVPAAPLNLATPPQVTVAGSAATVTSAFLLPGQPGVCRINFQVPAGAANGDQAVVIQVGTASSVSTNIPVQK